MRRRGLMQVGESKTYQIAQPIYVTINARSICLWRKLRCDGVSYKCIIAPHREKIRYGRPFRAGYVVGLGPFNHLSQSALRDLLSSNEMKNAASKIPPGFRAVCMYPLPG